MKGKYIKLCPNNEYKVSNDNVTKCQYRKKKIQALVLGKSMLHM